MDVKKGQPMPTVTQTAKPSTDLTDQQRLDAAFASATVTPARLSWARKVLDVYAATGSAAIAVASAPAWPAASRKPCKLCTGSGQVVEGHDCPRCSGSGIEP
jgi:hypothetical protein